MIKNLVLIFIFCCVCFAWQQTIESKKFIGRVVDAKYVENNYNISILWVKTDSIEIRIKVPVEFRLCVGDSVFIYSTGFEKFVGFNSSMKLYKYFYY